MNLKIELLSLKNMKDVYDFEIKNRGYFEKCLSSRGEEYYKFEEFNRIIRTLIDEQNLGECAMYILRDKMGKMIGRVNFFFIQDDEVKSAELGYRVGKDYTGKGIATEGVRIALELISEEYNLEKVIAGTSTENFASQKVLEKNGFLFTKKVEKYIKVNGKWIDSLNYTKFLKEL